MQETKARVRKKVRTRIGIYLLLAGFTAVAGGWLRQPTTPRDMSEVLDRVARARPISPSEARAATKHLQRKFRDRDVAAMLVYENKAAARPTKLSPDAKSLLAKLDEEARDYRVIERNRALSELHSSEAAAFVARTGEGFKRHQPPSVRYLELNDFTLIPTSPDHLADVGIPMELPATEPTFFDFYKDTNAVDAKDRYDLWRVENNPHLTPSTDRLADMHVASRHDFAGARNGVIKANGHATGFMRHAITEPVGPKLHQPRQLPQHLADDQTLAETPQKAPWEITQMHLVSVLRHNEPRAYVSFYLPSMEELLELPTRELSDFESMALEKLYEGEDIVTQAHTNRIRMIGTLRATTNCLDCHNVKRGDLLGAFSYELVRTQPVRNDNDRMLTSRE